MHALLCTYIAVALQTQPEWPLQRMYLRLFYQDSDHLFFHFKPTTEPSLWKEKEKTLQINSRSLPRPDGLDYSYFMGFVQVCSSDGCWDESTGNSHGTRHKMGAAQQVAWQRGRALEYLANRTPI